LCAQPEIGRRLGVLRNHEIKRPAATLFVCQGCQTTGDLGWSRAR
jgi:hypothetical protein